MKPEIWATICVTFFSVVAVLVIALVALSQGYDGVMAATACTSIGAMAGWVSRKFLKR